MRKAAEYASHRSCRRQRHIRDGLVDESISARVVPPCACVKLAEHDNAYPCGHTGSIMRKSHFVPRGISNAALQVYGPEASCNILRVATPCIDGSTLTPPRDCRKRKHDHRHVGQTLRCHWMHTSGRGDRTASERWWAWFAPAKHSRPSLTSSLQVTGKPHGPIDSQIAHHLRGP